MNCFFLLRVALGAHCSWCLAVSFAHTSLILPPRQESLFETGLLPPCLSHEIVASCFSPRIMFAQGRGPARESFDVDTSICLDSDTDTFPHWRVVKHS
jgi:hypothetical protein